MPTPTFDLSAGRQLRQGELRSANRPRRRCGPASARDRPVDYPGDGYSHQGWLTTDQAYFLHNDELDEFFFGVNTTTRIFDVRDLDNPVLVSTVAHDTTAIAHYAYTEGRYVFASNYTAGLRVFSTNDVAGGELPEVAYFDVYPENDNASFEGGTWSNYPYFSQKGIVAVSGIDRGLFILQPRLGKSGN